MFRATDDGFREKLNPSYELPPELVDAFRAAKRLTDRHSPTLEQAALAEFIQSGAYERHIRKLRRKNAQRRAALLDAFSQYFGSTVMVQGSEAGSMWSLGLKNTVRRRKSCWRKKRGPQASASIQSRNHMNVGER